jgi:hypothetical protein
MWACGVRRVVFECGTMLLVAVTTAVTRWHPGTLRDDQGGSTPDPQKLANVLSRLRTVSRPAFDGAAGARLASALSSPLSSQSDEGSRTSDAYSLPYVFAEGADLGVKRAGVADRAPVKLALSRPQ